MGNIPGRQWRLPHATLGLWPGLCYFLPSTIEIRRAAEYHGTGLLFQRIATDRKRRIGVAASSAGSTTARPFVLVARLFPLAMNFQRIRYAELNAKQKEIYSWCRPLRTPAWSLAMQREWLPKVLISSTCGDLAGAVNDLAKGLMVVRDVEA